MAELLYLQTTSGVLFVYNVVNSTALAKDNTAANFRRLFYCFGVVGFFRVVTKDPRQGKIDGGISSKGLERSAVRPESFVMCEKRETQH